MSLSLWNEHVDNPSRPLLVRRADGACETLPTDRWHGEPTRVDRLILDSLVGPALDIGCGPGRLTSALRSRGVDVLGVDISGSSVRRVRSAGCEAFHGSVYDTLPREGEWNSLLLMDGNVGIGGDASRLLSRARELLRPGGLAVVEVESSTEFDGAPEFLRLQIAGGSRGASFRWVRVSAAALVTIAEMAGFRSRSAWCATEADGARRCFVIVQKSMVDHPADTRMVSQPVGPLGMMPAGTAV